MRPMLLTTSALAFLGTLACEPLPEPRDVQGTFEMTYADALRIYLNDTLIAEVTPGSDETVEFDGQTFQVSAVCGDAGTNCPSEAFWREMAVEQPLGTGNKLLNFVNLDLERGSASDRLAGLMQGDGSFEMLAGIGLDGNEACAVLGVAKVVGHFAPGASPDIDAATIVYQWDGACQIEGTTLSGALRIETDVTAVRVGELGTAGDGSVPIDETGEPLETGAEDEAP